MYPIRDVLTNQYGYWNGSEWSIPPQFSSAYPFAKGYALVKSSLNQGYGFVNSSGEMAWINDLSRVQLDGNGFFDCMGRPCSIAICREPSGTVWLFDKDMQTNVLMSQGIREAEEVTTIAETLIVRWRTSTGSDEFGLFDFNGRRLFPEKLISEVRPSSDNGYWAIKDEYSWSFLDVQTGKTTGGKLVDAIPFASGLGAVSIDGFWYVVDDRMRTLFDKHFDQIHMFAHGYAVAFVDDHYGYLDMNGILHCFANYAELGSLNRFGIGIGNRSTSEWTLDLIQADGSKIVGGYSAVDFTDGDFPQFELWKDNVVELYSPISGQVSMPPFL